MRRDLPAIEGDAELSAKQAPAPVRMGYWRYLQYRVLPGLGAASISGALLLLRSHPKNIDTRDLTDQILTSLFTLSLLFFGYFFLVWSLTRVCHAKGGKIGKWIAQDIDLRS